MFTGLFFLPFFISGQNDLLVPKKNDEELYGYVNQFGKKKIDYRFEYAGDFYSGMAVVKTDSFYYINRSGEIISPGYELAYPFLDNYTIISRDGKFAYIDKDFKIVQNKWFDQAHLFQLRYAWAKKGHNRFLLAENGRIMRVGSNYSLPVQGEVHEVAEKMPHFPGGQEQLNRYLRAKLPGGVFNSLLYINFVVEKDGSLSGLTIMGEVNEDRRRAILSVFSSMPAWIPGRQGGDSVRVKMNIPLFMNNNTE